MNILKTFCPMYAAMSPAKGTACVVLVEADASKDYAAYIGIVPTDKAGDLAARKEIAEWVAVRGSKLNLKQAQGFFPELDEKKYRR